MFWLCRRRNASVNYTSTSVRSVLIFLINSLFGSSMLKTLERYQKCNYGAPEPNTMSAQEALVNFMAHVDIFSSKTSFIKFKEYPYDSFLWWHILGAEQSAGVSEAQGSIWSPAADPEVTLPAFDSYTRVFPCLLFSTCCDFCLHAQESHGRRFRPPEHKRTWVTREAARCFTEADPLHSGTVLNQLCLMIYYIYSVVSYHAELSLLLPRFLECIEWFCITFCLPCVHLQTQSMLDQLTDLQRKVWWEILFITFLNLWVLTLLRMEFVFAACTFLQEHLLNEANRTLKQRVCIQCIHWPFGTYVVLIIRGTCWSLSSNYFVKTTFVMNA